MSVQKYKECALSIKDFGALIRVVSTEESSLNSRSVPAAQHVLCLSFPSQRERAQQVFVAVRCVLWLCSGVSHVSWCRANVLKFAAVDFFSTFLQFFADNIKGQSKDELPNLQLVCDAPCTRVLC